MATEIEKDLIRWDRRKWVGAVGFILVVQVWLIVAGSQKNAASRADSFKETEIQLSWAPPEASLAEWLKLQDPLLFAAPNWQGFSSDAWMQKDPWAPLENDPLSRPIFLLASEIPKTVSLSDEVVLFRPNILLPPSDPSEPIIAGEEVRPRSRLLMDGFSGWSLAWFPPLPTQYANDVVRQSVVETIVDSSGAVLSARVVEGSGSRKADSDALALARRVQFVRSEAQALKSSQVTIGKLIFDWYALDFSQTNNVQR